MTLDFFISGIKWIGGFTVLALLIVWGMLFIYFATKGAHVFLMKKTKWYPVLIEFLEKNC